MNIALIFHYLLASRSNIVVSELVASEQQSKILDRIVVVDDASPEPYQHDLQNIEVIRNSENLGFVKSVNAAIKNQEEKSKELELAFLFNNDISGITCDMLRAMIAAMNNHLNLAAVSPAVQPSAHIIMKPSDSDLRFEPFIDFPCPLIRLSAWNEIGGFDENLPGYGCDIDFCKRGRDLNWTFAILPRFTVRHEMGAVVSGIKAAGGDDKGHSDVERMNDILCKKWGVSHWTQLCR